jgi:hypothetical protein
MAPRPLSDSAVSCLDGQSFENCPHHVRMSDMLRWLGTLALAGTGLVALHAATIKGVVRDPVQYLVDRTDVWVVSENCLKSRHAVTDQQGRYLFDGLPSGTYQVFATHPGFWLHDRTVHLMDTVVNLDLDLVISGDDTGGSPSSMPLHGVVTDSGGHPVSGARISNTGRERPNETLSAVDGTFGFCRVTGERVQVRIEHADYKPLSILLKRPMSQENEWLKIKVRRR